MLSKHHVELSVSSTSILFSWLIVYKPIIFVAIMCGVFIGHSYENASEVIVQAGS